MKIPETAVLLTYCLLALRERSQLDSVILILVINGFIMSEKDTGKTNDFYF